MRETRFLLGGRWRLLAPAFFGVAALGELRAIVREFRSSSGRADTSSTSSYARS
jgi:hypothetical protein